MGRKEREKKEERKETTAGFLLVNYLIYYTTEIFFVKNKFTTDRVKRKIYFYLLLTPLTKWIFYFHYPPGEEWFNVKPFYLLRYAATELE